MKIIAGPIVRHSNAKEINVWLVLDEKAASVEGKLYLGGQAVGSSGSNSASTFEAGARIFVYLLKIEPHESEFPSEQVLSYDLFINGQNLEAHGMTKGDKRICYDDGGLPGLVLKDSHEAILQGSCRKPHARMGEISQPDMLARADDLISKNANDPSSRPSLMFLTGDQIYADDVAAPMLAHIRACAKEYFGDDTFIKTDRIPEISTESTIRYKDLARFKLNGRAPYLTKAKGFTSGAKDNHLLSFSEYMMMYLLVWGGVGGRCPEYSEIRDSIVTDDDPHSQEWHLDSTYPDYFNDMTACNRFLEQSWKVRRALANVVTYMMFDDHEVTDDWNLTRKNYEALRNKAFSRHVQTNALAAFWLCQGWGNTPDSFSRQKFITPIKRYIGSFDEIRYADCANALLNHYWGFELDIDPVTLVLDTRTSRSFNENGLARLVDKLVLSRHSKTIRDIAEFSDDRHSLLVISPAPVYGFTSIERLQLRAHEHDKRMATKLDAECWIADTEAFRQLQSVIVSSGFSKCVIMSGDVHYGFCRYDKQVNADGELIDIYQFTSSSLHNAPGSLGQIGLDILAVRESFERAYSSYLFPDQARNRFLNQSTNIGILYQKGGKPFQFVLDSTAPEGTSKREKQIWYGDEKDNGFMWSYTAGKEQTLPRLS